MEERMKIIIVKIKIKVKSHNKYKIYNKIIKRNKTLLSKKKIR